MHRLLSTIWTIIALHFPLSVFCQEMTNDIEIRVDSILSLMTIEEKVAMCHGHALFASPGLERLGIPELNMLDGPHGIRPELKRHSWDHAGWTTDSATAFPALSCLAATFDPELAYRYGLALGEEARFREKDVLLGPGINIYRTPLNGRNFEYMGEDPLLAGKMAANYITGVQENGVSACVKHFAVNNQETGRHYIDVQVSDRALREIYLPAFRMAVREGGAWSLMGAYNKLRGQHCCQNDFLLNDILKDEWEFDGAVISDWGGTHDSREAAQNGLDIEMGSMPPYEKFYLADPFLDLLKNGEVEESVLDDKVRRILRLMLRSSMSTDRRPGSMTTPEHIKVAFDVAASGIVLLKNDDSFFPLDPAKSMTIAVIGENAVRPMAAGGGSAELKAKYEVSPLEGIRKEFTNAHIEYAPGYKARVFKKKSRKWQKENRSLRKEAVGIAADADVVLFIGGLNKNKGQDHEDHDRKDIALPYEQDKLIAELIKANPQTAVILVSGNAVTMPWVNDAKAVIQAWYGGSESGHALAAVLSGSVNPSGKLPFTFPINLSDNAAHSYGERSYPGVDGSQEYLEDFLVGYRWHDTRNIKPLFSFGHGMSYTDFTISNIRCDREVYTEDDTIVVHCEVGNTGKIDGAEVVQVYSGMPDSKVMRPEKELRGFKKVFVTKDGRSQVEIAIPVSRLTYYDEDAAGWKLEKGQYNMYVGNASDNITGQLQVTIK